MYHVPVGSTVVSIGVKIIHLKRRKDILYLFLEGHIRVGIFFFKSFTIYVREKLIFMQVFALFLETLCELVSSHKADMYEWLYVLLTRYI
jgi:hypothetical protein